MTVRLGLLVTGLAATLLGGCGGVGRADGDVVPDSLVSLDSSFDEVRKDLTDKDLAADVRGDSDVCVPNCKEGECGVDGCGGYCKVCATPSEEFASEDPWYQVNYTLCDETTRKCMVPTASCTDGWCRIPAASLVMGVNEGCPGPDPVLDGLDWRTATHIAVVTRPFRMMETEVTQQQWMHIMGESMENPSLGANCGPTCPITNISAWDIVVYANLLSQLDGLDECYEKVGCTKDDAGHFDCEKAIFAGPDCNGYRLPSFAEWQLAEGTSSDKCLFSGPAITKPCNQRMESCKAITALFDYGWIDGHCAASYAGCVMNASATEKCCGIHPVGSLLPNPFGLYDTAGNVSEWIGSVGRNGGGVQDPAMAVEVDSGYDSIDNYPVIVAGGTFLAQVWGTSPSLTYPVFAYHANLFTVPTVSGFRLARTGW